MSIVENAILTNLQNAFILLVDSEIQPMRRGRDSEVRMADTRERHTLREWRKLRDLSVEELATAAQVTVGTIYSVERNRHQPRHETMQKFAKALSTHGKTLTTDQIIWPDERPKPLGPGGREPKEE